MGCGRKRTPQEVLGLGPESGRMELPTPKMSKTEKEQVCKKTLEVQCSCV